MGGCQSKESTNVADSTTKPGEVPSSKQIKGNSPEPHKDKWFYKSGIHPEAVYVFKTTFFQPDGKQEKVFVNVFHHKKVPSEHCLVHDKSVVADKKGDGCFAYAVVIAEDLREKCLEEKYREWVSERIVELLNHLFPEARLDVKGVKLPIVKKGFMGDAIPFFSLDHELVSWTSVSFTKNATTTTSTASTSALTAATAGTVSTTNAEAVSSNPVASTPAGATTNASTTVTASTSATSSSKKESPVAVTAEPAVKSTLFATSAKATPAVPTPPPATATASVPAAAPATTTISNTSSDAPAVAKKDETKPVAPDVNEEFVVPEIPVPRRLTGWMKKQGHVAKNWKSRFFVLDHGFLTYYVDQQEKPPYGVDKKGQLCLAGYRDRLLMKRPDKVAYLVPGYDNNARKNAANAAAESAAVIDSAAANLPPQHPRESDDDDDNEYDENDDNSCMIQLEFYPQIIDANALDELKRRNGEATFKHDIYKEFNFICRTQQERDGWLAALEAHTAYIEQVAVQFSQGQQQAGNGGSNTPAPSDSRRGSFSIFGSSAANNSSKNNISRASRRASMALSAQKWSVFLNRNEKVVLMGIVEKPNPVGYRYLREMLLVQRQDPEDDPASAKSNGCRKRLIYIDSNSYEKKGEVLWLDSAGGKYPSVNVVANRVEVVDINGKQLIFYPKDDLTPEVWVAEINAIPPV